MRGQFKQNSFFSTILTGLVILILAGFLFIPRVDAQVPGATSQLQREISGNMQPVAEQTGLSSEDPRSIAGRIINIFLSILGVVALGIVLYAGFLYMTSGGEPEKVGKAKKYLINGFIGLAIILSAYGITRFLFSMFEQEPTGGLEITGLPPGYNLSGGAFGSIIQSHFPNPEQRGVPRNTMIMVTFKMPVDPASILDPDSEEYSCPEGTHEGMGAGQKACGGLILTEENMPIKVFRCDSMPVLEGEEGVWPAENEPDECVSVQIDDPEFGGTDVMGRASLVPGYAMMTADHKTIIFNPYGDTDEHLGTAEENVSYIVHLTPEIMREDGTGSVFDFANSEYYWRFTTGTFIDLTPPRVSSVIPKAQVYPNEEDRRLDENGEVYLNQIVVVNFNEPIIPPLGQAQFCTAGDADNEIQLENDEKIRVCRDAAGNICNQGEDDCTCDPLCDTNHVPGNWQVGLNGYKTVQFTSAVKCEGVDRNSCGEPAYCLPSESVLTAKVIAAELLGGGPAGVIGSGITDSAGNSLDGNANEEAEGPGEKNFDVSGLTLPTYPLRENLSDEDKTLFDNHIQDNYLWNFKTGDELDLIPPYIVSVSPDNDGSANAGVSPNILIEIEFSEDMAPASIDNEIKIYGADFRGWWDPNVGEFSIPKTEGGNSVYDEEGNPVYEKQSDFTKAVITHGPFTEYKPMNDIDNACANNFDDDGDGLTDMEDPGCDNEEDINETDPAPIYTPVVRHLVKDLRQNCFTPSKDERVANSDCSNIDDFPGGAGISCCPDLNGSYKLSSSEAARCGVPGDPTPACSDGLDNDGDGKVDFPNDPGCFNEDDPDEINPEELPECSDDIDNDGDEFTDYPDDPECESAADPRE